MKRRDVTDMTAEEIEAMEKELINEITERREKESHEPVCSYGEDKPCIYLCHKPKPE